MLHLSLNKEVFLGFPSALPSCFLCCQSLLRGEPQYDVGGTLNKDGGRFAWVELRCRRVCGCGRSSQSEPTGLIGLERKVRKVNKVKVRYRASISLPI